MKIGNLTISAAYLGEKVLTAIAVGATKVWEGIGKYIKFKDPVVEQLCMKWSSDGIGLTPEDAAKVTDIGTTFKGNTEITSFEEFENFTGLTKITSDTFSDCTNLRTVVIPKRVTSIGYGSFARSGIEYLKVGNECTHIGDLFIVGANKLKKLFIGEGLIRLGMHPLICGSPSLVVVIKAMNPPEVASGLDAPYNTVIYVPDESVDAYKSATNWSAYADKIKPLSEYVEPTNE